MHVDAYAWKLNVAAIWMSPIIILMPEVNLVKLVFWIMWFVVSSSSSAIMSNLSCWGLTESDQLGAKVPNRLFRRRLKLCVTGLCESNSLHIGPATRKISPSDDVIMAVPYPWSIGADVIRHRLAHWQALLSFWINRSREWFWPVGLWTHCISIILSYKRITGHWWL